MDNNQDLSFLGNNNNQNAIICLLEEKGITI